MSQRYRVRPHPSAGPPHPPGAARLPQDAEVHPRVDAACLALLADPLAAAGHPSAPDKRSNK